MLEKEAVSVLRALVDRYHDGGEKASDYKLRKADACIRTAIKMLMLYFGEREEAPTADELRKELEL